MTISYSDEVATSRGLAFVRLLCRWHGSVYKLLWKDLIAFLTVFYLLHVTYLFLPGDGKIIFRQVVNYASTHSQTIPLSFVLGFFVSMVMTRWWQQYISIPWPTGIAVYVSSTVHGYDEVGRAMRRTIMRYVCLSLTMVLRVLSPRVQKRFPKMSDMITAGLLHENELFIVEDLERKYPGYSKNFLPIVWASSIATRARKEGRIRDDLSLTTIIDALNRFRGQCSNLMSYNTISIPLVYTQVVTIAVYTFLIIALLADQLDAGKSNLFLEYFPFLITLQFIFYMGWLKVAETLMNPFGEDDDDFDVNQMIDRNLQTSYLIVDEMHNDHPELLKDQFWNKIPDVLPDRIRKSLSEVPQENAERDVIDYKDEERSSITRRNPIVITVDEVKDEAVEVEKTADILNVPLDLKPRSSIISGKFKNDPEAMREQNLLEKAMEEIRSKADQTLAKDKENEGNENDEQVERNKTTE